MRATLSRTALVVEARMLLTRWRSVAISAVLMAHSPRGVSSISPRAVQSSPRGAADSAGKLLAAIFSYGLGFGHGASERAGLHRELAHYDPVHTAAFFARGG